MKDAAAKGMYINLEDMIEFAKDGIVSKTLVKTPGREISLFCMSERQLISTHTSSFPAVIHIVRGRGEVTLAKEKLRRNLTHCFICPLNCRMRYRQPKTSYSCLHFKQTKQ